MNDKMAGFTDQYKQQADTRSEGEVTIETKGNASTQKDATQEGDYVDFEEIE